MSSNGDPKSERVPTGIKGLDWVLRGGLPRARSCLVLGENGSGKTTLALQFLREGARRGERCLYMTLLQTEEEVGDVARSHGWPLEGIAHARMSDRAAEAMEQTVFSPRDLEAHEVTDAIAQALREHRPQRLVLDSVTELGVLLDNSEQLRRQVLRIKRLLVEHECTALLTANRTGETLSGVLQTLTTGVIELERRTPVYGPVRRTLHVAKMRSHAFSEGRHDMHIRTGGVDVFPRLESDSRAFPVGETASTGNDQLDALLGGGLTYGSSCMIAGTAGAGKSTMVAQILSAAAGRGEASAIFCFDEHAETFIHRAEQLGIPVREHVEKGLLQVREHAIGDVSPGAFMQEIRGIVERDNLRFVVIDSLSGYMLAMPDERALITQLHDVMNYLNSKGVIAIMVIAMHGAFWTEQIELSASYLIDTMVVLRHFEAQGWIRRCAAVLKKRHGQHETTIREIEFGADGMTLGPPLSSFSGVLTGQPRYEGEREALMDGGRAGHDG